MSATKSVLQVKLSLIGYHALQDPFRERTLKLQDDEPVLIGRSSKNELKSLIPALENALFDSKVMSRSHATLMAPAGRPGRVKITDTSKYGVMVNGKAIPKEQPVELRSGDRIRFGDYVAVPAEEKTHGPVEAVIHFDSKSSTPVDISEDNSRPITLGPFDGERARTTRPHGVPTPLSAIIDQAPFRTQMSEWPSPGHDGFDPPSQIYRPDSASAFTVPDFYDEDDFSEEDDFESRYSSNGKAGSSPDDNLSPMVDESEFQRKTDDLYAASNSTQRPHLSFMEDRTEMQSPGPVLKRLDDFMPTSARQSKEQSAESRSLSCDPSASAAAAIAPLSTVCEGEVEQATVLSQPTNTMAPKMSPVVPINENHNSTDVLGTSTVPNTDDLHLNHLEVLRNAKAHLMELTAAKQAPRQHNRPEQVAKSSEPRDRLAIGNLINSEPRSTATPPTLSTKRKAPVDESVQNDVGSLAQPANEERIITLKDRLKFVRALASQSECTSKRARRKHDTDVHSTPCETGSESLQTKAAYTTGPAQPSMVAKKSSTSAATAAASTPRSSTMKTYVKSAITAGTYATLGSIATIAFLASPVAERLAGF